jgi:drug/metabolite transporter (DMT)-like permease
MALLVPIGAAVNWMLMQKGSQTTPTEVSIENSPHLHAPLPSFDMLPSVLIGASVSALITLPFAWPLQASHSDIALLSSLGLFQLAIPCLLAVLAAKRLLAHELAMLAMLEVLFGVLWVWVLAGEKPSTPVLQGGFLVLGALIMNEGFALREKKTQ